MKKKAFLCGVIIVGAALVGLTGCAVPGKGMRGMSASRDALVPLDTPPGITIQQLGGKGRGRRGGEGIKVYADSNGRTLYTSSADSKGQSQCQDECIKSYVPVVASSTAGVAPEWSVTRRSDGVKQWALSGKPLYTYVGDSKIGEVKGASEGDKGWVAARYEVAQITLPKQIAVREVPDVLGQALVDWEGHTLYSFLGSSPEADYTACNGGKEDCHRHWAPLKAPMLAKPVGGFSILHRRDGITQWTYQGRGLYLYDRDVVPELAEGRNADPLFTPALVRRTFMPPEVAVRQYPGISAMLTTAHGMSLYRRVTGNLETGTYYLLGARPYAPAYGYALGLQGCDAACERVWTPLRASQGSQSTGHWFLLRHADGSPVWSYRGSALYTYGNDKVAGDYTGDGRYQLLVSRDPSVEALIPAKQDGDSVANGVLTWIRAALW